MLHTVQDPASIRGRYVDPNDGEGEEEEGDNVLETQERHLAGRGSNEEHKQRRKAFLEEARRGDFWKSTKLVKTAEIVKDRLK